MGIMNKSTQNKKVKCFFWLKRMFPVTLFIMIFVGVSYGQNSFTVSGTVTEQSTSNPLPGVNILVVGTTNGTATNTDGQYQVNANSPNDSLRFSYIGYQEKIVPINGRHNINVTLSPSTFSGQEVVVVGYSSQERQNISGSVDIVDVDNLTTGTSGDVSKQLQGRASGVNVISSGQPGEDPMVRIRGINTFGNNSPLYIVDGVPTQSINNLNPDDVESMQVLKDAAAASIYGSRASNGVIIITTKNGGNEGVKVEYKGYASYDVPKGGNVWNILSPQEMADLKWQAIRNSGGNPAPDPQYGSGSEPVLPDYILPAGAMEGDIDPSSYYVVPEYSDAQLVNTFHQIVRANKSGTNWYDQIFSPALSMNHELAVSGGGENGSFRVSFSHLDRQGTLDRTYNRRSSIRANTQFNVNDNIRIGENMTFTVQQSPQVNALSEGSPIGMAYRSQPIIPVYDIKGNFAGSAGPQLGQARNPVAMLYRRRNNSAKNSRLFGNAFAEVDFLDNFTFKTNLGGELSSGTNHSFTYPEYENAENNTVNSFNANSSYGYNWIVTNTLDYKEMLGKVHSVEILLGTEAYQNRGQVVGGSTNDFFSFNPYYTNLSTGSGNKTNYSYIYDQRLLSLFGRVDYSYDNKYIFSATLRRDGSSKFENYKWGMFPAGSFAWRISQENFMKNVKWISDLRIRVGYGIMGNQLNVDPNNPYTLFAGNPASSYYPRTGSNNSVQLGFEQSRIGNPDAKWEKNKSGNIGIDATLFQDKLNITAEYYWKDIQDLLYNPELIGTAGTASQPYINVGNMKNKGVDATISTNGTLGGAWQYNASVNFTSYNNKIARIANNIEYFNQDSRRFSGSYIIRNEVGHAVSSYYGYKIDGFFNSQSEIDNLNASSPNGLYQNDARVGVYRYADINGDGQITPDDRTFLGNPNPDFTYGINFGLNFKNFDFSTFIYGSQGNDIWNQVKWWTDFYADFAGAKSKAALYDSWTPNNHDASLPIQSTGGGFSVSTVPNSYFVEDGSYLRVKNVILGFTLPNNVLSKVGISRLRLYAQVSNLFTITGYSGLDPEIGGTSTDFGIDEGSYASSRQFLFGINLSL